MNIDKPSAHRHNTLEDFVGKEVAVPIYVMLNTLTDTGRKALQDDPEILREINKEVEFMGVKILDQYALLGQYDFVNILEAPSNEIMAKLSTRLSAPGAIFRP